MKRYPIEWKKWPPVEESYSYHSDAPKYRNLIIAMENSFKLNPRSYIISQNLWDALRNIKADFIGKQLPEMTDPIYIQHPYFAGSKGVIAYCWNGPDGKLITSINHRDIAEDCAFEFGFFPLKNEETVEEQREKYIKNSSTKDPTFAHFDKYAEESFEHKRLLAAVIMYIHSGQPDVSSFIKSMRRKEKNKLTKKLDLHPESVEAFDHEVHFVGMNWKKPIHYHVDGTIVKGHFRWQPCGVRNSQVKLIWINEHERNFKQ
jgi:hypothetical protein